MDTSFYNMHHFEQIIVPLDQKRKQFDQEIENFREARKKELDEQVAEFKESKDRDYLAYKTLLQNASQSLQGDDAQAGVDGEDESGDGKHHGERKSGMSRQPKPVGDGNTSESRDSLNIHNTSPDVSSSSPLMRPRPDPGGAVGPISAAKAPQLRRESELQGLFTPGYLPLLDGTTNQDRQKYSQETALPMIPRSSDIAVSGIAKFSSSANEAPQNMASNALHQTRSFSSSAPHSHALPRSDSMRSDASIASLRSSLRNPSQPRSPKKVLFSIDNTVVSPSSSPVAQRRHTSSSDNLRKLGSGQLGTEKFEIVKKKKIKKSDKRKLSRVRDYKMDSGSSASTTKPSPYSSTSSNGWANAFRNWPATSASTKSTGSSSKPNAEDFERVEKDDDVFTFDEDMESSQPKKPDQPGKIIEPDDADDAETAHPLAGSSPHAGSLPIEIKWPAHKEWKAGKEFDFETRDFRG